MACRDQCLTPIAPLSVAATVCDLGIFRLADAGNGRREVGNSALQRRFASLHQVALEILMPLSFSMSLSPNSCNTVML